MGEDVVAAAVGAVAVLSDEGRGGDPLRQRHHLGDRVVLVQRGYRDQAVAGGGEEGDDRLGAARQPQGDALPRPQARLFQACRDGFVMYAGPRRPDDDDRVPA